MTLSIAQTILLDMIEQRAEEAGLEPPALSPNRLDQIIDTANSGRSLREYVGAAWEAASEIVYDQFPEYRGGE